MIILIRTKIIDLLFLLKKYLLEPNNLQTIMLWASALAVGLVSVGYATLFRYAEHIFYDLISSYSFLIWVLPPSFFIISWYLVWKFSPESSGSGIPQILTANQLNYDLNSKEVDKLLSIKTIYIKISSSLCSVLGGGAIGREGPTLQISASIFHFFANITRRFAPNINEQTWVSAGAAAGLASAFNTPLGGIVYAIEELGLSQFHKVRTALISGVIVSGLMAQWILGSYLYLGYPELTPFEFSFIPSAILCGLISGFLGAFFGWLLFKLLCLRLKLKSSIQLLILAMTTGFIMSFLIYLDKQAAGAGIELTSNFLFKNEHSSVPLIIIRFFSTITTYLSGGAGGIFSPSLTIGATIGSSISQWIGIGHPNKMIMLGMIGFLTGVTRTPFTSFILVLEMTDRHLAIFPMMLAALSAQAASKIIEKNSFYINVMNLYLQKIKS